MNTTISNTTNSNWKRIKGQYVAAAAGVALAVSAIVAFGPSSSATKAAAPVRSASIPAATQTKNDSLSYFYLVGNEEQRSALMRDIEGTWGNPFEAHDPMATYSVLVAGTPGANALWDEGAREMAAAGIPFLIIDMTSPLRDVQATPKASDADIAASALSTELANYLAPAETPKASDADVMASVISTEEATYGLPSVQRQASEADIMASVISTEKAAGY